MQTLLPTEVPSPKDVRDLFVDLFQKDVELQVIDTWLPEPGQHVAIAEYVDDGLKLRAIAVFDLAAAVFCGAAIGLLPPGGAKDMVAERDPSPLVLENLREVLNILGSVLNSDGRPHVKLTAVHQPGAGFPADVATVAGSRANRLDLSLTIPSYGVGRLAFVVA